MKNHLPSLTKDVYITPHVDILLFVPKSVMLGSNGSTQNYDTQSPWDAPDNE